MTEKIIRFNLNANAYTPEEIEYIKNTVDEPIDEVAKHMHRSEHAIRKARERICGFTYKSYRLTPADKVSVIHAYTDNPKATIKSIAEDFGCSTEQVKKALKERGIKIRRSTDKRD